MTFSAVPTEAETVEAALSEWRQGDITHDIKTFISLQNVPVGQEQPVDEDQEDVSLDDAVEGIVVVSQTCDLVNFGSDRNTVIVCPLVEVDEKSLRLIQSGRTPAYIKLSGTERSTLVADLSRMMTISKELLAKCKRIPGCLADSDRLAFAHALERKHGRFAFPDEFVKAISKFRERVRTKHDKNSDIGMVYQSLAELRVRAAPSWDAEEVELSFLALLIEPTQPPAEKHEIKQELKEQINGMKLPPQYHLAESPIAIGKLKDFTAEDYAASQVLDFHDLTIRGNSS